MNGPRTPRWLRGDGTHSRALGRWLPYALALVLCSATLGLRLALDPWLESRPTLTLFLIPVLVTAYTGGVGPGLFAVFLVAVGTNYFVIEPRGAFNFTHVGDMVTWLSMVVSGAVASAMAGARIQAAPSGEHEGLERKVRAGFLVALGVLVALAAISFYTHHELGENLREVRRAAQAVEAMRGLITAVRDVETDVGRYVITGDEVQAATFDVHVAAADAAMRDLASRTTGDARGETLSRLLARRIDLGREVIALRRQSVERARSTVAGGEGKRLVDEMRGIVDDWVDTEEAIGYEREQESQQYASISRVLIVLGSTLAVAFLLAAMLVVRREFAGRHRADAALREAHASLERRVAERTAELARSHDALQDRERQLDGIVDSAMDAIVTTDEDQRIVVFNAAAERMFGWRLEDIRGQPLERLVPLRFRPGHAARVAEFGRTRVTNRAMGRDSEIHGLRSDGTEFPIEASISQAEHSGKTYFTAILRDITQRKQAVEALRASDAQLRSVTDALPALIAHVGRDLRVLYANQAYVDWVGIPREKLVGGRVEDLLDAETFRRARPDFDAVLAGDTVTFERQSVRGDGEARFVSGILVPERGADGGVLGFFVLVNDVTERQRAETLIQRTQRMDALGTLAGGIAHDFNNILPAIRGFAAMAADDLPGRHPAREKLEQVEKAAARAGDLVRRILTFSRPQEKITLRIDLAAAIEDALKLVRAALPAMIEIRTDLETKVPEVDADPTEIYQVVLNLLTNAGHAIGSRPGCIGVGLALVGPEDPAPSPGTAGPRVRLTVSDDGCGMDAQTAARIFDPFFTTKAVGQGTGLGLSIVHGIMKKAGGTISVYSESGRGTRFVLDFPVPADVAAARSVKAPVVARGHGKRLMYIDDEEPLVFLANYMLKRLGYSVTGFTRADDALAALRGHPQDFDAVITDLSMPGMSGFDVAEAVREIRADLPVVVASGYVRPEDEEGAGSHGVRHIFLKPSTMEEYAAAIDRLFA